MFDMHSDFRFALFRGQYKVSKCLAGSSINDQQSHQYLNLKLEVSIVLCAILMFTFSNFQFIAVLEFPELG